MASEDRPTLVEPLPSKPSLEMQQKRAKELLRAAWAGDADALSRIRVFHPKAPLPDALKLADAQLVIARGYGFESWASMKQKIESLSKTPVERFVAALHNDDVAAVRQLLETSPEVRAAVNEPISWFDSRPVARAKKNLPMLDLLLAHGANLNLKSAWWAGGFGLLEYDCTPEEAAPLIARGAEIDIFAAANLGMFDRLRELVDRDPSLVHARGGDGKTALHCARTVEIAKYLVERGAMLDARDVDHESTAAQYLIREVPEAVRWLVEQGAWFDVFIAVGLRDPSLVERCMRDDPDALDHRTGQGRYTVAHNNQRPATPDEIGNRRGDIYRWVFDHNVSVVQAARLLGFEDMAQLLLDHASPAQRLLAACAGGDRAAAESELAQHPDLVRRLTSDQMRLIADKAHANDTEAVRLMIDLGFDCRVTGPDHGDVLHWASFHGNPELVRTLLAHNPAIGVRDAHYDATPLGWCVYGAVQGWARHHGNFPETVRLLLEAGERFDVAVVPTGRDDIDSVLRANISKARDRA